MTASRVSIALCISLAAVSVSGCEEPTTRLGPTRINAAPRFVSSSITVQSTDISAVPVPGAFCPFVSPFFAPFNLVVSADGIADMRLQQVRMQFVDASGISETFRTIDDAELFTLFGSTVIPAFGTRTFPLSLPFGCVARPSGFVNVHANTDSGGRVGNVSLQMRVR